MKTTSKIILNIFSLVMVLCFIIAIPSYGKISQQYLNNRYSINIYQHIEKKQYDSALFYTEQYYLQKTITAQEHQSRVAELSWLLQQYPKALTAYQQQLTQTKQPAAQQACRLKIVQCYAALSQDSLTQYWLRQYLIHSPKIREYMIQRDTFFYTMQHQLWWTTLWKTEFYTPQDLLFSELQWLDTQKTYEDLIHYYQDQPDILVNTNTDHQYLYAKALYNVGSLQSAVYELQHVIQKHPDHIQALQLLFTLYQDKQQYKAVVTTGQQLLKAAPYLYTPYIEIAYALYQLKKYKESQDYLTFYQQWVNTNDNAAWLTVLLAYQREEYTVVLEQITALIDKKYRLEETLLLRAEVYWLTDLPQFVLKDLLHRATIKPLTDNLILKYIKRFETLQDNKTCCLLLQKATTTINADIDFLRKKHCNTHK